MYQQQAAMDVEQGLYSAAGRQHHTPLASVPSENLGLDMDLASAWSEMSPAEQRQAMQTSSSDSRPGTRSWEQLGLARLRARRRGIRSQLDSDGQIATLDTDVGTIKGSGGDVPGVPDAWCSLYRVHQYREQSTPTEAVEIRDQLFGSATAGSPSSSSSSLHPAADAPRSPSEASSLCFTQQRRGGGNHF